VKASKSLLDMKVSLFIALFFSFILAYLPVWQGLVQAWSNSDDYSHGFFIVPLVIFSLWHKREVLYRLPAQSSNLGLALIIVSLVLYIFTFYAGIKTVSSLAMIFSIFGVVLYIYGLAISREIIFILLFLLFMIPVPAQIYSAMTIPLQLIVSKISVWVVMLFGVPVFREGNVIHLPDRTLEVVQACSGLRSLMTLLTLSMIVSYFTLRSNWLRMLLVISGVPVAIIVNILRVLIIIIFLHYFDFDLTGGELHTIFGVVVFSLAIALVFLIKGVFSFWDKPEIKKLS
jgi:exosortase